MTTQQTYSVTTMIVLPDIIVKQLKVEAVLTGDTRTIDDCNVVLDGSPGDDDYDAALDRLCRIISHEGT